MNSVFLIINPIGGVELDEAYTDISLALLKIIELEKNKKKDSYTVCEVKLIGLQKANAPASRC